MSKPIFEIAPQKKKKWILLKYNQFGVISILGNRKPIGNLLEITQYFSLKSFQWPQRRNGDSVNQTLDLLALGTHVS